MSASDVLKGHFPAHVWEAHDGEQVTVYLPSGVTITGTATTVCDEYLVVTNKYGTNRIAYAAIQAIRSDVDH